MYEYKLTLILLPFGKDDGGDAPDRTGFSFSMLDTQKQQGTSTTSDQRPVKRSRQ